MIVIKAKYIAPTNTKGSRAKLVCLRKYRQLEKMDIAIAKLDWKQSKNDEYIYEVTISWEVFEKLLSYDSIEAICVDGNWHYMQVIQK